MQPGRYTELFFLDEATAFAAGHRPCAECRREDYRRLQELWRELHPGPAVPTRSTRGSTPSASTRHARAASPRRAAGRASGRRVRACTAACRTLVLGGELLAWTAAATTAALPRPRGRARS